MRLKAKHRIMFGEDFDDPSYFMGKEMLISELPDDEELELVTNSQDTEPIKEYLGGIGDDYDSFFVRIKDGDYVEVYGFQGIVPWLDKTCYKLI